jgi:glutamate racemase
MRGAFALAGHSRRPHPTTMDTRPIGLFDSGVGGLTIWRAVRTLLPHENLLYCADQRYFPYGAMSPGQLRARTGDIVRFLESQDVKLIVVACNSATVHAIGHLRDAFPHVPFVGVVPVVKTLARRTRTGTIALLSTVATAESAYLADLIRTFASDLRVVNVPCDGLADLIEAGDTRNGRLRPLLERYGTLVQESGADVLGLGCTHYPFLRRRIKRIVGPGVRLFDSAGPVARRVRQLLVAGDAHAVTEHAGTRFYTTGDAARFTDVARRLLRVTPVEVYGVTV